MDTTLSCRLQRYTVSKLVTTSDIYKNIFSALGYADISGYLTRAEFLVLKVKKKTFRITGGTKANYEYGVQIQ